MERAPSMRFELLTDNLYPGPASPWRRNTEVLQKPRPHCEAHKASDSEQKLDIPESGVSIVKVNSSRLYGSL